MADFTSRMATPGGASDPTKHVNYTYGMVLGVDDLTQEFAYHSGRDQWTARDTIGYGTVNGLRVTVPPHLNGVTEVIVSEGTALSPRGQLIQVTALQCANLIKWLGIEKNRNAVNEALDAQPASTITLSVVLCYRACPTDKVPVPGEPCRTEEDSMAYSRLRDDFKLELRLKRAADPPSPDQREEDALRDFVRWVNDHLIITEEDDNLTDEETFINTLRQAAHPVMSPPSKLPPDFMLDAVPPEKMRVRAGQACDFMRSAFRLWTTELRPRWRPAKFNMQSLSCPPDGASDADAAAATASMDDNCVLLADLQVPLTNQRLLDTTKNVRVLEARRPYVLHLRMLQEWLMCGEIARAKVQTLPFVTIFRPKEGQPVFRLWFHLEAPGNSVALTTFNPEALQAKAEVHKGTDFFAPLKVGSITPVPDSRNVYDVELSEDSTLLRFVFNLRELLVTPEGGKETSLARYAANRNIKFVGQDEQAQITAFAPLYIP
jgi:hypothetical protein